jgi:serine/threonine-protein kinase HipA
MTSILQVQLHESAIGSLTMLPSRKVFFSFYENYANDSDRSILSQSFFRPSGELILESRASSGKLPAFFSNLLPEGHMRDYLAQLGNIKPTAEFSLIELLGEDLPGAVKVVPLEAGHGPSLAAAEEEGEHGIHPYHFSLAGVQLKFSAVAERHGGLTIPARGVGGDWIIKLPAQNYMHVPENEFAMMRLASTIGIPIPEIRLVPLAEIDGLPEMGLQAGRFALAVKRFDRDSGGRRIHIEDFAQVYNVYPENKYSGVSFGNIANMVWILTGEHGLKDFIRRLVFTILIGNGDMHLKNWSFVYPDGKTAKLAPAYDLVATVPYLPNDTLALKLHKTKEMKDISLELFRRMAGKSKLPEHMVLQTARDTVDATVTSWKENYTTFGLPTQLIESIDRHIHKGTNMYHGI